MLKRRRLTVPVRCLYIMLAGLSPYLFVQNQEPLAPFRWAYVWLAIAGFVLVLAVLAFAYLLARRHRRWPSRLLRHRLLVRLDGVLSDHMPSLWGFIRRRFTVTEWRGLFLTVAAVVFFVAIYLFGMITESSLEEEALYTFDQRIYQWLLDAMHPNLTTSMDLITRMGDGLTVAVISAVVGLWLLFRGDWWLMISLFLATGVGTVVMKGLKWIFERSRPLDQLVTVDGHSFPSGHAFMAMTMYGYLIYLVWIRVESDAARIGATMLLTLLIVFVGLSRVMLRVHWVSDVAGGLTVGLGWLVCSIVITRAMRAYTTK